MQLSDILIENFCFNLESSSPVTKKKNKKMANHGSVKIDNKNNKTSDLLEKTRQREDQKFKKKQQRQQV